MRLVHSPASGKVINDEINFCTGKVYCRSVFDALQQLQHMFEGSFLMPRNGNILLQIKTRYSPLGITEASVLNNLSRHRAADCLTTSKVSLKIVFV